MQRAWNVKAPEKKIITDMNQNSHQYEETDDPIIQVKGLKKYFQQSGGFYDRLTGSETQVKAVDGVDFNVYKGETLAVVGESGCGKSTLGKAILRLHQPTDGRIIFKGEDITNLSDKKMKKHRQDMQMVFQDPLASLNPRQNISEIISAPMKVHGIGENKSERIDFAKELLEQVGLKASDINRYPQQFSGGQQQRIAIARVLALEPELIIADEPVSALDVSVQAQILNLLDDLKNRLGLSLFLVGHDLSVVRHIADRVAVMYLGKIVEIGPTEEVFWNPQHPYTKSLLSAVPRLNPADRENRVILKGTVPSPIDPPSGCRFHTRCPVVIPPDDWVGTQEQFVNAFEFRKRLESGEISPDRIETRLTAQGIQPTTENINEEIIRRFLPNFEELPKEVKSTIKSSISMFVEKDNGSVPPELINLLSTPCEQEAPREIDKDKNHRVNCHRVDGKALGEPILDSTR